MSLLKGKLIMGKPTALHVTYAKPGLHSDGQGLGLLVGADGKSKSWVYRYSANGKSRYLGLGPAAAVPLSRA